MDADLEAIRRDVQGRLGRAARDRNSSMHIPAVATGGGDARLMVLREFDAAGWRLRFNTDARSPKVAAIEADPRVGVLFYDAEAKVQIRCRGRGTILTEGALVDAAWSEADSYARRCYLGEAPGTRVSQPSSGLPEWVEGKRPSEDELAPARANFALLLVEVEEIDWYHLAHTGHRRALLRRDGGEWLTP